MLEKLFGRSQSPATEQAPELSAEDKKRLLENADGLTPEGAKALEDIEAQELAEELAKEEAVLESVAGQVIPKISIEQYHELLEKVDTAGVSSVEFAQIEAFEAEQESQDVAPAKEADPLVLQYKDAAKPVVGGAEQPDADELSRFNRPTDHGFKEVA